MNKSEEILYKHFRDIRNDLIAKYDELGMRASGRWAQGLDTETKGLRAVIWGEPYTEQLVDGRKPGKFPPIYMIEQWIIDKGISRNIGEKISVSSLAFLIARKIAKKGTRYFQQGGTDLVESVITPERIQSILDEVSEFHINEFTSEIESFFKQIKTTA